MYDMNVAHWIVLEHGFTAFLIKAEKFNSTFVHFCNSYSYIWFLQFVC